MKRLWLLAPLLGLFLLESPTHTYASFAMPVGVPVNVELAPHAGDRHSCCDVTTINPSHQDLTAECTMTAYRPNGTIGFQGRIVGGIGGLVAPPGRTTGSYPGVIGTNGRWYRRPYKWHPGWRISTHCSAFRWVGGPVI